MVLRIVGKETNSIMYQGQPSTIEDGEELNRLYPVDKYKRFIGGIDVANR